MQTSVAKNWIKLEVFFVY